MNKNTSKRTIGYWLLAIAQSVVLTGCGELVDFGDGSANMPTDLSLSRERITLMVGDSCHLEPAFAPDDATLLSVFWLSDNDAVAAMANDTIVAVAEGTATVSVATFAGDLSTSVEVNVVAPWQIDAYRYPYEMMVYAKVSVRGQDFDPARMAVAAFCNDELRGVAQLRWWEGESYVLLRVYSDTGLDDEITFRCYDRLAARIDDFPATLTFDGESHGTLSSPYPLTLQ